MRRRLPASSISKLALLLLPALTADAAEPRLPVELEELAGLARSLPAEFSADILLKVAARLDSKHAVRRRAMVEDAFALADRAREPMPRRAAGPLRPGSADAVLDAALSRGFDRLSLQTRAVRQMHAFDPKLAAEYFRRLPGPPAPAAGCASRMVWDSSAYWETAAALGEKDLRPVVSPAEISAAIKALLALKLVNTAAQSRLLEQVEALSGDDRGFTAALRTAPRDLETLAIETARAGGDAAPVLRTLAAFLTRHLSARRCADTLEQTRSQAQAFVWYYNDRLRNAGYLARAELRPIRAEDTSESGAVQEDDERKEPEWLAAYHALGAASAEALAQSKLYEEEPLVWWLSASQRLPVEDFTQSLNPVLAAYARARNCLR